MPVRDATKHRALSPASPLPLGARLVPMLAAALLGVGCESRVSLGTTCETPNDCPSGLVCQYDRCRSSCEANADCPANATCLPTSTGGACGLDIDLGCETGVGRECPDGLTALVATA